MAPAGLWVVLEPGGIYVDAGSSGRWSDIWLRTDIGRFMIYCCRGWTGLRPKSGQGAAVSEDDRSITDRSAASDAFRADDDDTNDDKVTTPLPSRTLGC